LAGDGQTRPPEIVGFSQSFAQFQHRHAHEMRTNLAGLAVIDYREDKLSTGFQQTL
jgi:hypothetical protein